MLARLVSSLHAHCFVLFPDPNESGNKEFAPAGMDRRTSCRTTPLCEGVKPLSQPRGKRSTIDICLAEMRPCNSRCWPSGKAGRRASQHWCLDARHLREVRPNAGRHGRLVSIENMETLVAVAVKLAIYPNPSKARVGHESRLHCSAQALDRSAAS